MCSLSYPMSSDPGVGLLDLMARPIYLKSCLLFSRLRRILLGLQAIFMDPPQSLPSPSRMRQTLRLEPDDAPDLDAGGLEDAGALAVDEVWRLVDTLSGSQVRWREKPRREGGRSQPLSPGR